MNSRASITFEVLLFAGLRERAKADRIVVEVDRGATVADLVAAIAATHSQLEPALQPCRVAVDQTFVSDEHRLSGGEEIALIPPVSGGSGDDPKVRLCDEPLQLNAVVAAVQHAGAGGIATFTGNVRDHSRGHDVDHLEYEAYGSMALRVMREIVDDIEARIEGTRVAIHHRLGHLAVGETAVIIAASAPHRAQAFSACREAIEALKRDVPIWKREVSPDGAQWIGRGP